MEKLTHKLFYTALGMGSGLTGLLSASTCSGGICTSCFRCVAAGAGIVLAAAVNRARANKQADGEAVCDPENIALP